MLFTGISAHFKSLAEIYMAYFLQVRHSALTKMCILHFAFFEHLSPVMNVDGKQFEDAKG